MVLRMGVDVERGHREGGIGEGRFGYSNRSIIGIGGNTFLAGVLVSLQIHWRDGDAKAKAKHSSDKYEYP